MLAQQRVGEVTVDTQCWQRNIQTGGSGESRVILLSLRSPLSLLWLPDGLTRLVVPSRSLGAVRHGQGRAGLAVLTHHPVVGSRHLLLAVVGVEQQAGSHSYICPSPLRRRLVLLSSGGVVTKPANTWGKYSQSGLNSPQVQFSFRDPVRVEVGCQGGDVSNIGVVHQRVEGNGASVQIVEDLRPPPQITAQFSD